MKKTYEENYNSAALVGLWGDFVDCKKRQNNDGGFLVKALKRHGCRRVLDASLGDGCDSIFLIKKGFDVTSNDIDSLFIEKALMNAERENAELKITQYDWREFAEKFAPESFDAVVLLGNSLTYLFNKRDQLRAASAFRSVLRPGGILLIDERNYDYMQRNKNAILRGGFEYSRKHVYCGARVHAHPIEIKQNKVVMQYDHESGKTGFLVLYPFKRGELRGVLRDAGFRKIESYSDYAARRNPNAEFLEYIAVK